MINHETIVALATPQGVGAIGVIRLSGSDALSIANKVFKGKNLEEQKSHTIHYGHIIEREKTPKGFETLSGLQENNEKIIDEVMVSIFRSPKSFTTEDVVEISCHGSPFIAEQILRLLIQNGARSAKPGEFTLRAFMNGRIDLSQAEAVADLIASNSSSSLDLALKQMRGGFSHDLKILRAELVNFASLIELELDFGEEDVEFADRKKLIELIDTIQSKLNPLIESFKLGNVIKNGVNTVIAGKPNAGKSTLLNALLNEERAIVSEIPGTTRDTIEEVLNINGIQFRFIDTAGIRSTEDVIEKLGVEKTMEKLKQSSIYVYLFDVNATTPEELVRDVHELELLGFSGLLVGNKVDKAKWQATAPFYKVIEESNKNLPHLLFISANSHYNLSLLKENLYRLATANLQPDATVVTNARHYEALVKANNALNEVKTGIENQNTGELVALDIKRALEYLGQISGEVTNEEILGTIFSKFCIGK